MLITIRYIEAIRSDFMSAIHLNNGATSAWIDEISTFSEEAESLESHNSIIVTDKYHLDYKPLQQVKDALMSPVKYVANVCCRSTNTSPTLEKVIIQPTPLKTSGNLRYTIKSIALISGVVFLMALLSFFSYRSYSASPVLHLELTSNIEQLSPVLSTTHMATHEKVYFLYCQV